MKNNIDLLSKRRYLVTFIEGEGIATYYPGLNDILTQEQEDQYEWKYALQEVFDKILDLRVNDRYLMNFNRDNTDSGGIIKRIE